MPGGWPWTGDDTGLYISQTGFTERYNRAYDIKSYSFGDGTWFLYDGMNHYSLDAYKDGAQVKYDAAGHHYTISLPNGADITITANGATIQIDSSGNVRITANQQTGDIFVNTDQHTDSINTMINDYNQHTHTFVDSNHDTGTTATPTPTMP